MIRVKRRLNSTDVVDALTDFFVLRSPPKYIRSDNGAEFVAKKVRAWIEAPLGRIAFAICLPGNGRREDGIHHPRFTLEKWLLRELQLPFPR
tara:strand:+ start:438 stop:713 length:276 start_codon:yes stop_codon:yes gene_type:complete